MRYASLSICVESSFGHVHCPIGLWLCSLGIVVGIRDVRAGFFLFGLGCGDVFPLVSFFLGEKKTKETKKKQKRNEKETKRKQKGNKKGKTKKNLLTWGLCMMETTDVFVVCK